MNKFDNKNIFRNPYYSKLFLIIQERKEVYFMDKSKSNTDSEARSLTLWKISIAVILFFIAGLFIGMVILQHVMNLFKAEEIIISKYGVREGYLWQKIMKKTKNNTITPKIEN